MTELGAKTVKSVDPQPSSESSSGNADINVSSLAGENMDHARALEICREDLAANYLGS